MTKNKHKHDTSVVIKGPGIEAEFKVTRKNALDLIKSFIPLQEKNNEPEN